MAKTASWLAGLACVAAMAAPAAAQDFSDEEFCRVMTEEARTVNRRNPSWIDRNIRNDGMAALCLQKTIEYRTYMKVDPGSLMTEGWESRHQAQWSRKSCREPLLSAIRAGWRIVEIQSTPKSARYPDGLRHRVVAVCG